MDITTMSAHDGSQDDAGFAAEAINPARERRFDVGVLEARIRHYNSDLGPQDPTFRAAVILLAGFEYGHNIDLLARRTGYDRAFVARIGRRLIDNGVWKAGVTVADWTSADEASGTFWNDVAVAEGKMCRRLGPDGQVEWAPAGFWNKNFGFIDPGADQRLATLYLDPSRPGAPPEDDNASANGGSAEAAAPVGASAAEPAVIASAEPDAGETAEPAEPAEPASGRDPANADQPPAAPQPGAVPSLDDLFGDVVWIG